MLEPHTAQKRQLIPPGMPTAPTPSTSRPL
jgi:hypothetical protein